ncbi:MAG TPA: hypothetical protein VGO47_08555, partial [Chlamydiales bacterium]|nr:hypothetical protein [Chlamydiales bacterium]
TLNSQFLASNPFPAEEWGSNALRSLPCNAPTLKFMPQPESAFMDCSLTPPTTPPFKSTGYTSLSSPLSFSIETSSLAEGV